MCIKQAQSRHFQFSSLLPFRSSSSHAQRWMIRRTTWAPRATTCTAHRIRSIYQPAEQTSWDIEDQMNLFVSWSFEWNVRSLKSEIIDSDWHNTKNDKRAARRDSRIFQTQSEKHLPQENPLQASANPQLASHLQHWRCSRRFGGRLDRRLDSHPSSTCVCWHRSTSRCLRLVRLLPRLLHLHFLGVMQRCANGWVEAMISQIFWSINLRCCEKLWSNILCSIAPGPTAIASLLTFQTARGSWQKAVLLSFLTGFTELFMGFFGLGFLIDFVSGPVSSGFTSAVALIILSSQVKDIFGIKGGGNTFIEMWRKILENIHDIRLSDTILGFSCIVILLLMRVSWNALRKSNQWLNESYRLKQLLPNIKIGPKQDDEKSTFHKIVNKTLWLIGTARNAIIVIAGGALAAYFYENGSDMFKIIGDIPQGLPPVGLPPFSIPEIRNETTGEILQKGESFTEMVSSLGSGLIVVPLIALLENIAICKAFSNGKAVDATQELIAIGTANIANSFVLGYPGTGALSRGAVNNASGVRTPLGSLYTGKLATIIDSDPDNWWSLVCSGILVILSLLFFTPYFFYIPKSALAGIIISAVVFMVEVRVIKPMWRSKKSDLVPGLAAFAACLVLPIELGILVGIGINILFILYHASRPKIHMERVIVRHVQLLFLFPSI